MHDRYEEAYHIARLRAWWEELWWRWWEELKESFRTVLLELGTDVPSKDDIKFYALAAGPLVNGTRRAAFRMPTTFQVEDHETYFHQVIVPRLLRTQDRLLCKQVNQELDSIGRGKKSTRGAGEVEICRAYRDTGTCSHGSRCKFQHLPRTEDREIPGPRGTDTTGGAALPAKASPPSRSLLSSMGRH